MTWKLVDRHLYTGTWVLLFSSTATVVVIAATANDNNNNHDDDRNIFAHTKYVCQPFFLFLFLFLFHIVIVSLSILVYVKSNQSCAQQTHMGHIRWNRYRHMMRCDRQSTLIKTEERAEDEAEPKPSLCQLNTCVQVIRTHPLFQTCVIVRWCARLTWTGWGFMGR